MSHDYARSHDPGVRPARHLLDRSRAGGQAGADEAPNGEPVADQRAGPAQCSGAGGAELVVDRLALLRRRRALTYCSPDPIWVPSATRVHLTGGALVAPVPSCASPASLGSAVAARI